MIARSRPPLRGSRSPAPGPADSMPEFPLTTFDLAALAVIGLSVLVGFLRGLIRETLTIVTWIGAGCGRVLRLSVCARARQADHRDGMDGRRGGAVRGVPGTADRHQGCRRGGRQPHTGRRSRRHRPVCRRSVRRGAGRGSGVGRVSGPDHSGRPGRPSRGGEARFDPALCQGRRRPAEQVDARGFCGAWAGSVAADAAPRAARARARGRGGGAHDQASGVHRGQAARGVRRVRHPRQRRRRGAHRARPARLAAPRPGGGRDRQLRRSDVPQPPGARAGRRSLQQRDGDRRAARSRRDRPRPLLDRGRAAAAQRPAAVRRLRVRRPGARAQRQPDQRARAPPPAGRAGLSVPVDLRYRGDHPPDRPLAPADRGGAPGRRARSGAGRVRPGRPVRRRPLWGARSAGHPAAGDRRSGRRADPRFGDLRARHHGRAVRARRRAGRGGQRDRGRHREREAVRRAGAALLHLRVCLLRAPGQRRRGAQRVRGQKADRRGAGARGARRPRTS